MAGILKQIKTMLFLEDFIQELSSFMSSAKSFVQPLGQYIPEFIKAGIAFCAQRLIDIYRFIAFVVQYTLSSIGSFFSVAMDVLDPYLPDLLVDNLRDFSAWIHNQWEHFVKRSENSSSAHAKSESVHEGMGGINTNKDNISDELSDSDDSKLSVSSSQSSLSPVSSRKFSSGEEREEESLSEDDDSLTNQSVHSKHSQKSQHSHSSHHSALSSTQATLEEQKGAENFNLGEQPVIEPLDREDNQSIHSHQSVHSQHSQKSQHSHSSHHSALGSRQAILEEQKGDENLNLGEQPVIEPLDREGSVYDMNRRSSTLPLEEGNLRVQGIMFPQIHQEKTFTDSENSSDQEEAARNLSDHSDESVNSVRSNASGMVNISTMKIVQEPAAEPPIAAQSDASKRELLLFNSVPTNSGHDSKYRFTHSRPKPVDVAKTLDLSPKLNSKAPKKPKKRTTCSTS